MTKIREKAIADKMTGCEYSRVLDIYEEEQERGKTHEFSTVNLSYNGGEYELIDTPGHQKFIRSMIEGISFDVNIAMILVSMKENEFEASLSGGMTKEHLTLARAIGIEHLIIVANKMDLIDWDEKKCKKMVMEITKFVVKSLNWPRENLHVVPISAFQGVGLLSKEGLPDWYKGKSLLDTIDSIPAKSIADVATSELKETDQFFCDLIILCTSGSGLISVGYKCFVHFKGKESEASLEKIQGKSFLRNGDSAKCLFKLPLKYEFAVGMRIIVRKNNDTVGYGTIIKV